jgi:hypothetical protein
MIRVCVFGWLSRVDYPGKPPFFGGMKTWVFLKKFDLREFDEKKIKKILKKIDRQFYSEAYKILIYTPYYSRPIPLYYKACGDEDEF